MREHGYHAVAKVADALGPVSDTFTQGTLADLFNALDAHPDGLSETEAARRLAAEGSNTLQPRHRRRLLFEFLSRFRNPLVVVLLVASGIAALTGDVASFIIISAVVLLSVILDFVQEHRAGQAADRLRQSVAVHASVLRGGQRRDVPVGEIVRGDIVELSAGDLVPADGRVLEAKDFFVNQALLTGESYPIEKRADAAVADQVSVFMGTSVVSGSARMIVCLTNGATALGRIADSVIAPAPPTSFERGAREFGLLIMRLTLVLVLFVLLINGLFHRPLLESFLFAVALAVGLTPELLPMIVSVTLARGALRMARRQVIVKRLSAVQDLGAMDVLCTDKTGTLTEAHIRLERHVDADGHNSDRVLQLAYLNSYFETGLRSPLDRAILDHGEIDVAGWKKIDEVPFDFERRRVSVLVEHGRERLLVVKGAPEDVLRLCSYYEERDKHPSLDTTARARIASQFEALSREGFRVLGIAWRSVPSDRAHVQPADEVDFVFAGFAAFFDPPKDSARSALISLTRARVRVVIITGDNELVARHVCEQLGLPVTGVVTGTQLQEMDDHALRVLAERANLFCRITPSQKTRILLAIKARGHVVGFLGDGINDAPSLHAADVGISVDSAVDVAKETAALILLQHDLNVLYDGVREGRRTFGNVLKYIMMATSSNFGNMFSMAAATLVLPFLPMLPLQILLNNLLYDISEVPIPLDNVDEEDLAHPREWDMRFIRNFMLGVGPVSSVFDFFTFFMLIAVFHASETLFRTGWFIESVATQVLVIFVIRTRGNPFVSRPNCWLALTSITVVVIAMALPFMPAARYLGFTAPPPLFFVFLLVLVVAYLLAVHAVKRRFYRAMQT